MPDYDSIGSNYDLVKRTPQSTIEKYNAHKNIEPFLKGNKTRVIDFACGTGFYSHLLLTWGATGVLGIDLSEVMIKAAVERLAGTEYTSHVEFIQGDATKPQIYTLHGTTGFGLATGFWLLNYAASLEEMTAMFQTISKNLTSDGVFIGFVPRATNDVAAHAELMNNHDAFVTGVRSVYLHELANKQGYAKRFIVEPPKDAPPSVVRVDVGVYHLKKSVYEEAARTGGMMGKLEWRDHQYLDKEWTAEMGIDPEDSGWQFMKQHPGTSILVVHKS